MVGLINLSGCTVIGAGIGRRVGSHWVKTHDVYFDCSPSDSTLVVKTEDKQQSKLLEIGSLDDAYLNDVEHKKGLEVIEEGSSLRISLKDGRLHEGILVGYCIADSTIQLRDIGFRMEESAVPDPVTGVRLERVECPVGEPTSIQISDIEFVEMKKSGTRSGVLIGTVIGLVADVAVIIAARSYDWSMGLSTRN